MLIGIVDYGIGNILSVFNSIYNQGYDPIVVKEKKDFKKVDKLIIPGVGSAFKAMELLKKKDFYYCILDFYNNKVMTNAYCFWMEPMKVGPGEAQKKAYELHRKMMIYIRRFERPRNE
mgnify:CR=1 FL=1